MISFQKSEFIPVCFAFFILYQILIITLKSYWSLFQSLPRHKQLDFVVRIISTLHAIAIFSIASYILITDNKIYENKLIYRSNASVWLTNIAIGYFIYDTCLMFIYKKELFNWQYLLHHLIGIISSLVIKYYGYFGYIAIIRSLSEASTLFINLRWFLLTLKLEDTKLYIWNGIVVVISFGLVRILALYPLWMNFYECFSHKQWHLIHSYFKILCVGVTVPLDMLNIYWYSRIISINKNVLTTTTTVNTLSSTISTSFSSSSSSLQTTNLFTSSSSDLITTNFDDDCVVNQKLIIENERIIEGSNAMPHKYPWLVSLRYISKVNASHICGGSILSDEWIITAGHCIRYLDQVQNEKYLIVTGLHYLNEYNSSQVYIVDKVFTPYNSSYLYKDDLALLKLKRKIQFDNLTSPIEISNKSSDFFLNKCLVTAGWGSISTTNQLILPDELQQTFLKIINTEDICNRNGRWQKDYVFCTMSPSSDRYTMICLGDSGGPLMSFDKTSQKWYLEGLVSYLTTTMEDNKQKCLANLPGYFTKVYQYKEYINQTLTNN
ncbi:unnamed protein product [Brachionus calyciflorus]|uniref:Uncharacterized protein n=1 Tax=Brachionus calyciflorus TaxID=104777 RepID=A0A813NGD2_9BILA|nr:unnamed protein product [Brachionus calyciflorus]